MLRHGVETETGYIIIVMCRQRTLVYRQTKIVEHIDGIHIVLDVILKLSLLFVALRVSHIANG